MSDATTAGSAPATARDVRDMVLEYLEATMAGRADALSDRIAPDCEIVFSGGRVFASPADIGRFNAGRYRWVKKRMERTDVATTDDAVVVYSIGALYGEWPDGTPFDGNRYIDRFEVRDGVIVRWEVWNDSGERLLEHHGIEA